MNRVRVTPIRTTPRTRHLVAALLLAGTFPSAAEAALRKCGPSTGPAQPVPEAALLMVDGVIVGDGKSVLSWGEPRTYSTASGATTIQIGGVLSYSTPSGLTEVSGDQVLYFTLICVEHEMEGRMVPRATISIGTRAGAEGMMRRYLAELAELQDAHRRSKGEYASALPVLGFHLTRHPLPIELNVVDGGWSGTTTLGGKSCRIAVGTGAATLTRPGEVECI